jgi:hypothetical protein
VANDGKDFRRHDPLYVKHDATVIEQQDTASGDVPGQILVVEADTFVVAQFAAGIEDEALAGFKPNLAVGEFPDADFRALEIGENAHRAPDAGSHLAHQSRPVDVVLRFAMGEVEPHDIDAGANHPFQHLGVR